MPTKIITPKTIKCPHCGKDIKPKPKRLLTCPKCKRIIPKPTY